MCVDCTGGKFLYKEAGITVTTATTSNFSQPENLVVFECVCRLLAKGYKPKDIELEPAWKFGHNEKAARADIWVRTTDKSGKHSLLIIECKTAGREFESAWRDTCEDGGQLFSYFHQERATSFLCLYTSDLVEDKDGKKTLSHEYRLINVRDNVEFLKTLKKPKTYAKADNAKSLFAAWRDTYRLDAAKVGLFEPDIAPYKPGKNKYSLVPPRAFFAQSAQPNINAQQYSNLKIPVPSLAEQKKIVAAVEAVEAKIASAKETMSACPARKREILRMHGVVM